MTDAILVINPGTTPLTPGEQAAGAYLEQRKTSPLPAGWTESFGMLPCTTLSGLWSIPGSDSAHPGRQTVIVCHIESPDYAIELLFLSYQVGMDDPSNQPAVGALRLEFFRKDRAAPTDLETVGMAQLFSGTYLGPITNPVSSMVLDGDIDDRPFPSDPLLDPLEYPDKLVTRVLHFGLLDARREQTPETVTDLRKRPLPKVWKNNTRTTFKSDLSRTLKRHLKMLRVVQRWLDCCDGAVWPDLSQADREAALAERTALEERHGVARLHALTDFLVLTSTCDTDASMRLIGIAHSRIHGQIAATKRLLRRITSERY